MRNYGHNYGHRSCKRELCDWRIEQVITSNFFLCERRICEKCSSWREHRAFDKFVTKVRLFCFWLLWWISGVVLWLKIMLAKLCKLQFGKDFLFKILEKLLDYEEHRMMISKPSSASRMTCKKWLERTSLKIVTPRSHWLKRGNTQVHCHGNYNTSTWFCQLYTDIFCLVSLCERCW